MYWGSPRRLRRTGRHDRCPEQEARTPGPARRAAGEGARMTKVGHGPMLAKLEPEIPRGPGWTYEPKWDGFRTIVTVGDEIRLESRDDRPMMRFFPELVTMLEERRDGPFVADGEIVLVRPGRLSFDELQLRLHPAESRVRKLAAEIPASPLLIDL